ncbi:MAG: hypothetical protein AMXMBFR13_13780 [Phycisphaerae bacterium]
MTYQTQTWAKRPFADFKRALRVAPPDAGPAPLREVERVQPREATADDHNPM